MEEAQAYAQVIFAVMVTLGLGSLVAIRLVDLLQGRRIGSRRAEGDFSLEALSLFLFCSVTYVVGGGLLQAWNADVGLPLAQLLFLAVPAILLASRVGPGRRETLSLSSGSARLTAWGIVMGLGTWVPIGLYVEGQSLIFPMPDGYEEAFAEVVIPQSLEEGVVALLTFALVPALCEEVLFRGAVLGYLRSRLSAPAAVVVTATLFGLLHLDPFRIVPTAILGLALGAIVVVTGSLWAAVALHLAHNATLLTLGLGLSGEEGDTPTWLVTLGLIALVCGVWGLFIQGRFMGAARAARPDDQP